MCNRGNRPFDNHYTEALPHRTVVVAGKRDSEMSPIEDRYNKTFIVAGVPQDRCELVL